MRVNSQPIPLQAPTASDAAQINKVARDMEGLFAQMMIKQMRETVQGDAMFPGAAGQFRDLYDEQIAKSLTEGRGLGLAPMIARQLSQQNGGAVPAAPEGPLPLNRAKTGPAAPMLPLTEYARPLSARPLELLAARSAPVARENWIAAEDVPRLSPAVQRTPAKAEAANVGTEDRPAANRAEAFVEKIWPHAQKIGRELGVDPRAIVAQAALETGWGRSTIRAQGDTANNYFGIKATGRWQGEKVATQTQEFVNGEFRMEQANFRAYDGVEQSFADYAALLKKSPRYAEALNAGSDIRGFAQSLQRAGYATDPAYARKIEAIAHGPTLERALARLDIDDARGPAVRNTMFAGGIGGL
jgi:flagellar protein FlgJ